MAAGHLDSGAAKRHALASCNSPHVDHNGMQIPLARLQREEARRFLPAICTCSFPVSVEMFKQPEDKAEGRRPCRICYLSQLPSKLANAGFGTAAAKVEFTGTEP